MANPEHLAILKQGVEVWNEWKSHQNGRTSLADVKLYRARLENINFRGADLRTADLRRINLSHADLVRADLTGANLSRADLTWANLKYAHLNRANLEHARLIGAYLAKADLKGSNLCKADLSGAILNNADLTDANLAEAFLDETILSGANFTRATGLDKSTHGGPSAIDLSTLRTIGAAPLRFLRGVGLPDVLIEYLPSLLHQAIQFYSCFISYSSRDRAFADSIHAHLQDKGVRCWFAPEDLKIGDELRPTFDEAIRIHEKLLLILSEHSIRSPWVKREVERALDEENKRQLAGRKDWTVLFPVRVDDSIFRLDAGWATDVQRRHIGDFSNWKNHEAYQQAFQRLLRDLKASDKEGRST